MFATSVNGLLGHSVLIVGLVSSLFGAIALATATITKDRRLLRSAPNYAWLAGLSAIAAALIMLRALLTFDFDLAYVQQVGSRSTPMLYNVAALWSALEGSILLWLATLGGYTAVIMRRYRKRLDDPLVAWALVVMFVVTAFFFLLAFGPADAFAAGTPGVNDGPGPNPLLQNHILVLFHPPILYLGYVGFTVPFAFAIAALVTGRVGEGWLMETRRWALFAWGFLTIGILLGGWWSYEVLGWSGVWAWDPVENASFLPWLTGTAYIHSVLVQERRGMLRVWNISLLIATFALTILGTFLTRSGVINSVHAFADGDIGPVPAGLLRARRRGVAGADRLAWRSVAFARRHRFADLARGRVPGQQRRLHRVRVRGAAGHRVPADRRGVAEPAHRRGAAVLRFAHHADRAGAAVPDGRRPGAAVAQGQHASCCATGCSCPRGAARSRWPSPSHWAPTSGPRSSPSGSAGSPPVPQDDSWCSPPVARAGVGWSAGPTAA